MLENYTAQTQSLLHEIYSLDPLVQLSIYKALEPIARVVEQDLEESFIESGDKFNMIELTDGSQWEFKLKDAYFRNSLDTGRLKTELPDIAAMYTRETLVKASVQKVYRPRDFHS